MVPIRRLALALSIATPVVCGAQQADTVPVDSPATEQPSLHCYRGYPLPACNTFTITEFSAYPTLWSTSQSRPRFPGDVAPTHADFGSIHAEGALGAMRNVSGRSAIGALVVLGGDGIGFRYGAKLRYRRWLTPRGLSLDASAGAVSGGVYGGSDGIDASFTRATILSGDLSINSFDYGALTTRVELARTQGRTRAGWFGGARLGFIPGLVSGAIGILLWGAWQGVAGN